MSKIVRFHTRVPMVAPERVTDALVRALTAPGGHDLGGDPRQPSARIHTGRQAAVARLADAGIPLVSQTVLLAGVNDDAETLAAADAAPSSRTG